MKREDKIFYGTWAVVGIISFLLLINSYNQTPDEYTAKPIIIEGVPSNADRAEDIKAITVSYDNIIYGKNVSFLSVKVNDENSFKIKKFDQIKFSIDNKKIGTTVYRDEVVISIRGVVYSDLPLVYDYREELFIQPKEASNWYDSQATTFSISDNPPWVLNVKTSKVNTVVALFVAGIMGGVIGFIAGLVAVIINRIWEYSITRIKIEKTGIS